MCVPIYTTLGGLAWLGGNASALGTEDHQFESRQGVSFVGL
jgi:hypothetical protein